MRTIRHLWSAALIGTVLTSTLARANDPTVQELGQPRVMPNQPQPNAPAPVQSAPVAALGTDPCAPTCPAPPAVCPPVCGPRIRVIVPPPQITYRKTCATVTQPSCSDCSTVTAPQTPNNNFGGAPSRPQQPSMTTINVPYTHYVPVQTFGMVPFSGVAAAPTVGFGAAPTVGFGAANTFGFGGVQPVAFNANASVAGFGASGGNVNEAALLALMAGLTKGSGKETGFGSAPGEEGCKKELAELTAQVDKIRTELADFKKSIEAYNTATESTLKTTFEKIALALANQQTTLSGLDKKVGNGFQDKSLSDTITELNKQLDALKTKGGK